MFRIQAHSIRTCDELLLRNQSLIEQAEAVVADVHRQGRKCADMSKRTRARGVTLRERSKDLTARLSDIQAGTEDRFRKSQQASDRSEALASRHGKP